MIEVVCAKDRGHTEMPGGYGARSVVAEQLIEAGYRQRKCEGCGLYVIWSREGKDLLTWRSVPEVDL